MSAEPLVQIGAARPSDGLAWTDRLAQLRAELARLGPVVVAYSGGVDSSVLLRVAHEVLGEGAVGVIGVSDSYSARELRLALEQAAAFGARVETVTTGELGDPAFRSNPVSRCYHCKTALYRQLRELAGRRSATVVDGTIADDLSDWRPGRRAAGEHGVRSPLAELGFTKADVRAVAAEFGLASQSKPASPCLASRIPYGTEITPELLRRVELAEEVLRSQGFDVLRVRHHGDLARIEVPAADIPRLLDPRVSAAVRAGLREAGYRFVAVDLEGFRSGKLNDGLVPGGVGG